MKRTGKIIGLLLTFVLVLDIFFPAPFSFGQLTTVQASTSPEPSELPKGTFGQIDWKLKVDPDGKIYSEEEEEPGAVQPTCYELILEGTGEMDAGSFSNSSSPWYDYREVITSVSIGEGITNICSYGLANLVSLKSMKLPDSIASIGQQAFQNDYSLETVTCGTGLNIIGDKAFSNCFSLGQITFQEGLETIGVSAFEFCRKLTSVTLPDSLTTIKKAAFDNAGLNSITIPRNVSCIEVQAFAVRQSYSVAEGNTHFQARDNILYELKDGTPCRALAYAIDDPAASVSLAEGTELVDPSAFADANNITSLTLPGTLTRIGQSAFIGMSNLNILQLSEHLQVIEGNAFKYCLSLKEVNIPDSVETIGGAAFSACPSLKTFTIGKGLKGMEGIFYSSDKNYRTTIETITVDPENSYLRSLDNVVYTRGDEPALCYYASGKPDQEYHVPEPICELSSYAIDNAVALEELYLPKTLEYMLGGCITDNKNLKSVYFAGNAPYVYGLNDNHASLILYRTADSTGWDDPYRFDPSMYTLGTWEPDNTLQESGSFDDVAWIYKGSNRSLVFSGSGSIPDFTTEEPAPWSGYMDSIQTIEAKTVTNIGDYGFCNASGLLRVETGAMINRIGDHAFSDCTSLKFLDIPSIDSIGTGAFQNCSSIAVSLTLEKISSLGAGAFQNCSSISAVTLGSRLDTLEQEVFAGCSSLASLILPEKVSTIGSSALKGCTSLRSVNIPAGTAAIGAQAFSGDTALEKVYFYGGIPADWAQDSFENCGSGLTLCYRTAQTDWAGLGGSWNGIPLLAQERFYTERQDHYSFSNSSSSYGYPAGYHFPKRRYVETLGSISIGTYYYVLDGNWKGSCYGMAGSTLEFYENPDEFPLADYSASADALYGIAAPRYKFAALTKLIETCQISSYHLNISGCGGIISRNMDRYQEIVQRIEEFERAGGLRVDSKAEPIILTIYSKYSGHAVIPVSVDQDETGNFLVKIYDPNYPAALQTLTVWKDFSGISYHSYFMASYVPYGNFIASMSGQQTYSQENQEDSSLYLSIDKEYGTATDTSGRGVDEIEGAYEQKSMTGEEEFFTGIRRFVLPKGNYQLTTNIPEGASETTNPDSVTFYMGSADCFAEITSSDENAVLTVTETDTSNGELVLELHSDSQTEETAEFTLVNAQGMERTLETGTSNATLSIGENNITVNAPGQESVIIDGQETALTEGQTGSSFTAGPQENPLKISGLETEITCGQNNKLNGSLNAEVVSNTAEAKEVTVTAEFFGGGDTPAAVFSEKTTLNPGLNLISLSLEELETAFQKTTGDLMLSCRFTVTDENDNSAAETNEGISITLTEQENPGSSDSSGNNGSSGSGDSSGNNGSSGSGGSSGNDGSSGSGGSSGNGGSSGSSGSSGSGGSSNSGNTKPGTDGTDTNSSGTDDSEADTPPAPPKRNRMVTDIKVNVKNLTLGVGETFSLKASVLPENASDKTLRFTASNKNITVSAGGKISARKTGSSKITITSSNGKTETVKISVKKKPSKITLNAKTKIIKAGWKFQIKVKFPKGSASHKLTYSSNRKSVATVSSTGKVTARKRGTAIITVRTYNGKKAKLKIIVKK